MTGPVCEAPGGRLSLPCAWMSGDTCHHQPAGTIVPEASEKGSGVIHQKPCCVLPGRAQKRTGTGNTRLMHRQLEMLLEAPLHSDFQKPSPVKKREREKSKGRLRSRRMLPRLQMESDSDGWMPGAQSQTLLTPLRAENFMSVSHVLFTCANESISVGE